MATRTCVQGRLKVRFSRESFMGTIGWQVNMLMQMQMHPQVPRW